MIVGPLNQTTKATSFGQSRHSKSIFQRESVRFVSLEFASLVEGNHLFLSPSQNTFSLPLLQGWQIMDLKIEDLSELALRLEQKFIPEKDDRELGLMLRRLTFHSDEKLHATLLGKHQNRCP